MDVWTCACMKWCRGACPQLSRTAFVYVCMCVYACACVCMYVYVYVYTCMYKELFASDHNGATVRAHSYLVLHLFIMYVCMRTCIYACTYGPMHV